MMGGLEKLFSEKRLKCGCICLWIVTGHIEVGQDGGKLNRGRDNAETKSCVQAIGQCWNKNKWK